MKMSHSRLSSHPVQTHHMLVIEIQGSQQIVYLSQDNYSIGRKSDNNIVIKSDKVSRYHGTIIRRVDQETGDYIYWIIDGDLAGNKSHNGIFINRQRQFVHRLKSGDVIHFSPEIKASYHTVYHSSENRESNLNKIATSALSNQTIQKNTWITIDPLSNNLQEEPRDTLNEFSNHQIFINYLSHSLNNAERQQHLLGLGLLEIENFTNLSTTSQKDLTSVINKRLQAIVRQGDFVYSWQEGQFMILLSHLKTADDLIQLAPRILSCFGIPIALEEDETSLQLTADLGISVYPYDGLTSSILIENTKNALHKAQEDKSSQIGFYNAKLAKKSRFIDRLDILIQKAFKQEEFTLSYQPQIDLNTQKIEGMEALLRWEHPSLGMLFPQQFLALAEKGTQIIDLGNWLLDNVCQQIIKWQSDNLEIPTISLNLSPQQFYHSQLVATFEQKLTQYQLNPCLLAVEITENTLMKNSQDASRIIHQLDQLGISCIVDDFCGEQVSLQQLEKLPIKTIKIARHLIDKLKTNPQDTAIIAGIIALENHFGLTVLAKGVETQRQLKILRYLQCRQIQGNLWSPPLSVGDMTYHLSNVTDKSCSLNQIDLKNWQKQQNISVQGALITRFQAEAS